MAENQAKTMTAAEMIKALGTVAPDTPLWILMRNDNPVDDGTPIARCLSVQDLAGGTGCNSVFICEG